MHLQHLTLQVWDTDLWEDPEWTALSTFSNVEALAIRDDNPLALRRALTNTSRLTELDMRCLNQDEDWKSVLSLSGLRSLSFRGCEQISQEATFELHSLHRLPLLTRLITDHAISGVSLCCVTNLVDLTFQIKKTLLTEVQEALVRLTNLESLEMSSAWRMFVSIESIVFAQLKKLRQLSLTGMLLEEDFVLTIGDLSELKHLHFCGHL